jgi:hypothetical protein
MKKIIIAITAILLNTNLFAQNTKAALDYLNPLGKEFKDIQSASWDYTKAAANNKSARKINKRRLELIQQIDASTKNVKKFPPFEKQTYLKDSILAFLRIQKIVIAEDYAKIMDLEDVAESSYDAMEAYFKAREIASNKLEESSIRTSDTYNRFAKENNIRIAENGDEDKISKQLKIADEVYGYYNPMYLIFFKAYKQELYMMAALEKGDIAGMEQNKGSLSTITSECQTKLKAIKPFRGNDNSILKAANDLMAFYKSEADIKFPKMIDFYTKKEAFEKAQKAFESNNNISKEDVDNYNKMIGEFNKASADYNTINNELNNKRSLLINAWNNASQGFTAKYL